MEIIHYCLHKHLYLKPPSETREGEAVEVGEEVRGYECLDIRPLVQCRPTGGSSDWDEIQLPRVFIVVGNALEDPEILALFPR